MKFYNQLILSLAILNPILALQVTASVDRDHCSIDDLITFKIVAEDASSFPKVDTKSISRDFSIISGPSQQTNMQWVNGAITNSRTMTWSIVPKREGLLSIPSLTVKVKRKTFKTKPIKIQVVSSNRKTKDLDLFILAEIDKDQVYLGEQVTLTYKIFKKVNISIDPFELPDFDGFWAEELYRPRQVSFKNVSRSGVRYQVGTLYQVALFPMLGDKHVIPSLTLKTKVVANRSKRRRDPFFDPFFDSFFTETVTKVLNSPEKSLTIKDFPESRPYDFTGAVGQFSIDASTDRDSIVVNEGLTYTISLKGTGNMGLFTLPDIKFPNQLEAFSPTENFTKDVFRDALTGTMSSEYILIPRMAGSVSIPPVKMSYFDPQSESWKRIQTDAVTIPILAGEETLAMGSGFSKREIELLGRDIRYIHTEKMPWKRINAPTLSPWILSIYGMSVLLFFAPPLVGSLLGYRVRTASDRKAKDSLKKACRDLRSGTGDPFDLATSAVYKYLHDRLQLSTDNLDPSMVEEILSKYLDNNDFIFLLDHLNTCDAGRFGPEGLDRESTIIDETIIILNKLDKVIGK